MAVAWANGRASLDFAFQRTYYFSCRRLVCRPPARHAMSVGPGPTHGRSNLSGLTWDLLLVPSRPMPDASATLWFVCCVWGGFLQGRRLGGLRAVLAVPPVVPVLVQHLQDSTLYRWYRCDSCGPQGHSLPTALCSISCRAEGDGFPYAIGCVRVQYGKAI